jgi:hypothetical protein
MEVLEKRMVLDGIFEDRGALEPLVAASGGYPRDLLRMVREVLLRARMEQRTIPMSRGDTEPIVTSALAGFTEQYESAISDEDIELLVRVAKELDIAGHARSDLQRLADLFDHHFVLSYRNGNRWFDLHPLVRRTGKISRRLAAGDAPSGGGTSGAAEGGNRARPAGAG